MKNPALRRAPQAGPSTDFGNNRPFISDRPSQAQRRSQSIADQLASDGIPCGSLWKSPRDRTRAIQVSLRSYQGGPPYADVRLFETDPQGRMRPTTKGIAVSINKLGALSQAIGNAYRKASQLGLITGVSS